jgi:cell wall-associated NlpC family hydrolase
VPNGRRRFAAIAATLTALIAALVGVGLGVATPTASAKPDLETVKKKVEKYDHLAEQASERYNDAKVKLAETETRLQALNADLNRQQHVVDVMRQQVATMVVDQYQGDALSTTSQVVLSRNPDKFLDNLNAVSAYNNQRGQVMKDFSTQLDRLKLRKDAVTAEAKRLTALKAQMKAEKAVIDDKAAKAQDLLDHLEAEARAKLLAGEWTGDIPDVEASGRAAVAVKFAMAQVGKAYVYGASGPNAYDCSGLTMRAWGAAGVSLPHSSSAQQGSGVRVSENELRPGDLVFYYSPVSHVGMYIGHGMIVNALNPSSGVRVSSLHSMPYSGAVRPG